MKNIWRLSSWVGPKSLVHPVLSAFPLPSLAEAGQDQSSTTIPAKLTAHWKEEREDYETSIAQVGGLTPLVPAPARNSLTVGARTKSASGRLARLLFGLLTLTVLAPVSPKPAQAKDEWLPINPADLALKDNPASPGSDATILYREESVNDAEHFETEYYRIKIFSQAGTKQGNVEIPYNKGLETIGDVRARTIRPDGTIVNFTGQVYDKVVVQTGGVKVYEKTFSLPDVQPGCIIEYKYYEPFDPGSYFYLTEWAVQQNLYTRDARFSFVPLADPYQSENAGFFFWRTLGLSKDTKPERKSDGSFVLEVHDIPGLTDEPYTLPRSMIRSRVEFYYRQRSAETTDHFWKRTGKDWDKELEKFIDKKGALQQALQQILHPNDSPETQLHEIYVRVQKIRNLSLELSRTAEERKRQGITDNHNVEDVLKHGYGTGRDLNFLFIGLARAAGFSSTEVRVAPRNQDLFVPDYQDPSQLGADVVEVRVGSQELYLDPASFQCPFGLLPWYETAVRGVRLSKDGGEIVSVPSPNSSEAQILWHANLRLSPEGSLSGTLEVDYAGQEAAVWRDADRNDDETARRKDLHDEIKGWLPTNATFEITKLSDWDDNSKPIRVEGNLNIAGVSKWPLGRIIMPLSLFASPLSHAFAPAQRVNDVYFHFPFEEEDDTRVQLPSGFRVESLPKTPDIPSGAIRYQIGATANGTTVQIIRKLVVDGILFPVKYYSSVRTIFNTVKAGDDDDLVLASSASAQQN